MPTSTTLFSQIVRIEDGVITNSGAITDASIASVLSQATVENVSPVYTLTDAKIAAELSQATVENVSPVYTLTDAKIAAELSQATVENVSPVYALTDAKIAAELSGDTVEGALSDPDGLDSPVPELSVMMAVM